MKTITNTIRMARVDRRGGVYALARDRNAMPALLASTFAMVLALFSNVSWGEEPPLAPVVKPAPVVEPAPGEPAIRPVPGPARKNLNLPGLTINFQERCVDIESSVCLKEGTLELIACTKGTKEHESIVAIEAKPMHVHAALLLLGATPGNPAMRKPIDEQGTRWIDMPPKGDPVAVYLVFKNKEGKMVEHPIGKFIAPSENAPGDQQPAANRDVKFSGTFLFAGSLLRSSGTGPRSYMSDLSGNVISVVTFGDELLCLPDVYGSDDGSLMWQVDATNLPAVGSKVTLRLRPKVQPAPKAGKADLPPSVRATGTGRQ